MNTSTLMHMFAQGALAIARWGVDFSDKHAGAGFAREDWELLTQNELWSAAERRRIPNILHAAVNMALEQAGLPYEPLPGQYVAACIVVLVAPCNRIVAAHRAPPAYDAISASGLDGAPQPIDMPTTQLLSLVLAYSSGRLPDLDTTWPIEQQDAARRAATS